MWRHLAVSLFVSLFIGTNCQSQQSEADYDTLSCDFDQENLCNWESNTSSHNLKWVPGKTTYLLWDSIYYAHLDVSGKPAGSSAELLSPWLDARPGHSCSLSFVYYIQRSDRCRLTLFQENATCNRCRLWTTTQASGYPFSSERSAAVQCSQERYRLIFKGERLHGGDCYTYFRRNNDIDIDDIVFEVEPDSSTTSTITTTTTTTITTTTVTSTEQDTPTPTAGSSGRNDASSGTTVKVNDTAVAGAATGPDSGAIAGIAVVAVVLVVVAVGIVVVVVVCRRKRGQGWMMGFLKGVRNKPAASESHVTSGVTNNAYLAEDDHIPGAAAHTTGDNHVYRNVPQNLYENSNTSHAPNAATNGNMITHAGTSKVTSSKNGRQDDYEMAIVPVGSADSHRQHQAMPYSTPRGVPGHGNQLAELPPPSSGSGKRVGEGDVDYYNQRGLLGPAVKGAEPCPSPSHDDDPSYNHLNTRPVPSEDPSYNHLNTRSVNITNATPSAPTADDTYYYSLDPYEQHADKNDQHADEYDPTTNSVQRDNDGYTIADTTTRNPPAPNRGDSVYALGDTSIYEVGDDDDPQLSVYEDACNHLDVTGGSAKTPDVKLNDQDDYNHLGVNGGSPKTSDVPLDNQETYSHLNANQETYSNLQHNDGMGQDAQRTVSSDQYSHI